MEYTKDLNDDDIMTINIDSIRCDDSELGPVTLEIRDKYYEFRNDERDTFWTGYLAAFDYKLDERTVFYEVFE